MLYGLSDVVTQQRWIDASTASREHKRVESMRLDAMLGFAESATCRRRVLLAYFGEDAGECGNCDVCLEPPQTWDGTTAAQKLLSAAIRTGQRFGAGHLIDVLRGTPTPRVTSLGHDRLPTFGVGADLDPQAWRSVARQMVAAGLLHPDATAMGALRVTGAAQPVLRGEATVMLRRRPAPAAATPTRAASGRRTVTDLSPDDRAVFEALRAERRRIAEEAGVPAFVVLQDVSLRAMAQERPADLAALLRIPGVGTVKAEKYGDRFLSVLAAVGGV